MPILRWVLLVANPLLFAWLAYLIFTSLRPHDGWEYWAGRALLACLALNFIYLLAH